MRLNPLHALLLCLALSGTPALGAGPGLCGTPATPIAEIQGSTPTSPLAGHKVEIEAVVTADYSGPDGFKGFFVQQADAQRQHRPVCLKASSSTRRMWPPAPATCCACPARSKISSARPSSR